MAWDGEIAEQLARNARRLDAAFAAGLRPPPRLTVSEWAAKHRQFPDDHAYPGPWRQERAAYLVEIMDALSAHDPCEEVILLKCAQSGGTAAIENWLGYISDVAPGPVLFVQATLKAALDWSAEKFWPMVEATPRLDGLRGGTIRALGEASGDGSTKFKIRFRTSSSYIALAGGNSAPSLRSRTVRYAVEDDLDQFPDDLDGQGSPEAMIAQRLKVYRRQGLSKRAKISTPTIKGASKIEAAFEAEGVDRRRFRYRCPHCAKRFAIVWEPQADGARDIQWPEGKPEEAWLRPRCCGDRIEHWQKAAMTTADGWLSDEIDGEAAPLVLTEEEFQGWRARMPRSRRRGFDLDGMLTSFQTWADMATEFVAARGDQNKLKGWCMLTRGAAFELRGDAPDHEALMALREQDWGKNQTPAGPVVITLAADVQGDGIYFERVGWAEEAESWSLLQGFIPGATDVPLEGAWVELDRIADQPIAFPGGRGYRADQVCVDAGFNTQAVLAFCARRPNRLPVFGRDGWMRPVLGRGESLRYERQGSRSGFASKKAQDKAYLVGVDGVKAAFYGYLRNTLKAARHEAKTGTPLETKPRGLCHFSQEAEPDWFEQITSETVIVETQRGFPRKRWKPLPGRQNHYLDCRVYNIAAAEKLMLDTLSDADWARLRSERHAPADPDQGDLLSAMTGVTAPTSPVAAPKTETDAARPGGFIDVGEGWLDG